MGKVTPYYLTPTARRQLREAKAWSLRRWGTKLTEEYFTALEDAARDLAANYRKYPLRDELSGGTGLRIHPVRERYFVYEPIGEGKIIIIAGLRQCRDIAGLLSKGKHLLVRESRALQEKIREGKIS